MKLFYNSMFSPEPELVKWNTFVFVQFCFGSLDSKRFSSSFGSEGSGLIGL